MAAALTAAIAAFPAGSIRAEGPGAGVPSELLVVYAQPAVFQVLTYGRFEVEYPHSLLPEMEVLKQQYAEARRNGVVPASLSQADFFWARIAADGPKCLKASKEIERTVLKDVPYGGGTAFAIDPTGVLLTNAHVIADPLPEDVLKNPLYCIIIFGEPLERAAQELSKSFGGAPPQAIADQILGGILRTLLQSERAKIEGTFSRAEIVLYFGTDFDAEVAYWKAPPRRGLLTRPPAGEPIALAAQVVAKGKEYPGVDVAILRALRKRDAAGRLVPETIAEQFLARQKPFSDFPPPPAFISLPLGDSDEVLEGAPVQALGFPGGAYRPNSMRREAEFRVSSQNGQIGRTKVPMKGGWDAFEMTADINHGDSGGPVLDKNGRVIALNVAGTGISAHKIAVPINLAKDMLRKAGIEVQPGAITQQWENALRLYSQGRYAEAKGQLETVARQRDPLFSSAIKTLSLEKSFVWRPTLQDPFGKNPSQPPILNLDPYVKSMIVRCDRKLRTGSAQGDKSGR